MILHVLTPGGLALHLGVYQHLTVHINTIKRKRCRNWPSSTQHSRYELALEFLYCATVDAQKDMREQLRTKVHAKPGTEQR